MEDDWCVMCSQACTMLVQISQLRRFTVKREERQTSREQRGRGVVRQGTKLVARQLRQDKGGQ